MSANLAEDRHCITAAPWIPYKELNLAFGTLFEVNICLHTIKIVYNLFQIEIVLS